MTGSCADPYVPQYDLAVTGTTTAGRFGSDLDAFLVTVDPATMLPRQASGCNGAGIGMVYGKTGNGALSEEGWSVSPVYVTGEEGFILCGFSTTVPSDPTDPSGLYLVKTDPQGIAMNNDDCEQEWSPFGVTLTWNPVAVGAVATSVVGGATPEAPETELEGEEDFCCTMCKRTTPGEHPGDAKATGQLLTSALRSYPNPVRRGDILSLEFTSSGAKEITVALINSSGEIIRRINAPTAGGTMAIPLTTEGLPVGSYVVNVSDGTRTNVVQVVVIE
jgi:hypothetical protein